METQKAAPSGGSFMKAFVPGLVFGLVVGALAGAFLPGLLGATGLPEPHRSTSQGPAITPRSGDETPVDPAAPEGVQPGSPETPPGLTPPPAAPPADPTKPEPKPEPKPAEPKPAEPAPAPPK